MLTETDRRKVEGLIVACVHDAYRSWLLAGGEESQEPRLSPAAIRDRVAEARCPAAFRVLSDKERSAAVTARLRQLLRHGRLGSSQALVGKREVRVYEPRRDGGLTFLDVLGLSPCGNCGRPCPDGEGHCSEACADAYEAGFAACERCGKACREGEGFCSDACRADFDAALATHAGQAAGTGRREGEE